MNEAVVCIHCGCSTQNKPAKPVKEDGPNIGMAILGFFIPLVGLIIWAFCKDDQPLMANSAGKGALIGVITEVALSVLATVASLAFMFLYFLFIIVLMGGFIYF